MDSLETFKTLEYKERKTEYDRFAKRLLIFAYGQLLWNISSWSPLKDNFCALKKSTNSQRAETSAPTTYSLRSLHFVANPFCFNPHLGIIARRLIIYNGAWRKNFEQFFRTKIQAKRHSLKNNMNKLNGIKSRKSFLQYQ